MPGLEIANSRNVEEEFVGDSIFVGLSTRPPNYENYEAQISSRVSRSGWYTCPGLTTTIASTIPSTDYHIVESDRARHAGGRGDAQVSIEITFAEVSNGLNHELR